MKSNAAIPAILFVTTLLVIVFFLGGFVIYDSVTSDRSASDDSDNEVTDFEARRIHAVAETQIPPEPPCVDSERGVVTESTDDVIRLEGSVGERVWPVADDAEVWKQGEKISADQIEPGEIVSLQVQKLGSRQDGWIPTVTRIKVDPLAAVSSADTDIPDGHATTNESPDANGLRGVHYSGAVVEAEERTITIRDSVGDELSYAVDETATVRRDDQVGSLAILQEGDQVTLIGRRVGDLASGQTVLIDRISVEE